MNQGVEQRKLALDYYLCDQMGKGKLTEHQVTQRMKQFAQDEGITLLQMWNLDPGADLGPNFQKHLEEFAKGHE